jgi:hypothetical protein
LSSTLNRSVRWLGPSVKLSPVARLPEIFIDMPPTVMVSPAV